MSWGSGLLLFAGGALVPAWLLVTGRRLRMRTPRVRGAFWGGVVGHVLGDILFLGVLLDAPLVWPPEQPVWVLPLLLLVPPAVGVLIGAVVGKPVPLRHG